MKVLKQYLVTVYDDGSLTMVEVRNSSKQVLSNCSSSIKQTVEVLEYVHEHLDQNIHYAVTDGVNHVAAMNNVQPSSVHSKLTRKLNLSMADFKKYVSDYINKKDNKLEDILRNACVARTKTADALAVDYILNLLKQ